MDDTDIYTCDDAVTVVKMYTQSLDLIKSIIDLSREYNTKNSSATLTIEFNRTHIIFKNTIYFNNCLNHIEVPISWCTGYEYQYPGENSLEITIEIKTLQKIIEKFIFMKSTSIKKIYTFSVVLFNYGTDKQLIIEHSDLNSSMSYQISALDFHFEKSNNITKEQYLTIPDHSLTIDSMHIHNIFNMFYGKTEDMKHVSVSYDENKLVFNNRDQMSKYTINTPNNTTIDNQMDKTFMSVCLHGLFSSSICNSATIFTLYTEDVNSPLLWKFDVKWGNTIVRYFIWTHCLKTEEQPQKKRKMKS
jgi:hypothetical protein